MHTHQIFLTLGVLSACHLQRVIILLGCFWKKCSCKTALSLKRFMRKIMVKLDSNINYSLHGIEWTGGTIAIFYTVLFKDIAGYLKICFFFFILENLFCEAICDLLKFGTVYFPKQRYFFYLADPSGIWKFLSISFMQI